jgi:hydrogenase maturation protease
LTSPLLLIAIGDTLRSDDGAGHVLADRLAPFLTAAGLTVSCIHLHQLVPETVEDIAAAGMVVFIDAALGNTEVEFHPVVPTPALGASPHMFSPENLMALVNQFFPSVPPAFLLTAPGKDFSHGESLSQETQTYVIEATEMWRSLRDIYFSSPQVSHH